MRVQVAFRAPGQRAARNINVARWSQVPPRNVIMSNLQIAQLGWPAPDYLGLGLGGLAPSKMKSRHFLAESPGFGAWPCCVFVPPVRSRFAAAPASPMLIAVKPTLAAMRIALVYPLFIMRLILPTVVQTPAAAFTIVVVCRSRKVQRATIFYVGFVAARKCSQLCLEPGCRQTRRSEG